MIRTFVEITSKTFFGVLCQTSQKIRPPLIDEMPKLSTHSSPTTSSRQTDTGRTKNKSCRRTTQRSNKHVNYNITIASPSTIDLSHKYRHIPHQNVERKDFLDTYYLHRKASKPAGTLLLHSLASSRSFT